MTREQAIDRVVRRCTTSRTRREIAAYVKLWGFDENFDDDQHYGPEIDGIQASFASFAAVHSIG